MASNTSHRLEAQVKQLLLTSRYLQQAQTAQAAALDMQARLKIQCMSTMLVLSICLCLSNFTRRAGWVHSLVEKNRHVSTVIHLPELPQWQQGNVHAQQLS